MNYYVHASVIFGIPFFARELVKVAARYGIRVHYQHNLVAVDGRLKTATFEKVTSKSRTPPCGLAHRLVNRESCAVIVLDQQHPPMFGNSREGCSRACLSDFKVAPVASALIQSTSALLASLGARISIKSGRGRLSTKNSLTEKTLRNCPCEYATWLPSCQSPTCQRPAIRPFPNFESIAWYAANSEGCSD